MNPEFLANTAEAYRGTTIDDSVCTGCRLAKMLERGAAVHPEQVDAGHSQCEGTRSEPCSCGCDYSRGVECKECQRKGTELDDGGQCADRRDCANTILAAYAARRAERVERAAKEPTKRSGGGGSGQKRPCTCGCGETTGGGLFKPGHDARMVSRLTKEVKAGETPLVDALGSLPSDKLREKLKRATGAH